MMGFESVRRRNYIQPRGSERNEMQTRIEELTLLIEQLASAN